MNQVDFTVTITGGAGIGVFINVGGSNLYFPTSGSQSINLAPANYTAVVSGSEPSSTNVQVDISEAGNILQSSTFSTSSFWGLMPFTVV